MLFFTNPYCSLQILAIPCKQLTTPSKYLLFLQILTIPYRSLLFLTKPYYSYYSLQIHAIPYKCLQILAKSLLFKALQTALQNTPPNIRINSTQSTQLNQFNQLNQLNTVFFILNSINSKLHIRIAVRSLATVHEIRPPINLQPLRPGTWKFGFLVENYVYGLIPRSQLVDPGQNTSNVILLSFSLVFLIFSNVFSVFQNWCKGRISKNTLQIALKPAKILPWRISSVLTPEKEV